MGAPGIKQKGSAKWSRALSNIFVNRNGFDKHNFDLEETVIYQAEDKRENIDVSMLQITIRKAISGHCINEKDDFEHALQVVKQSCFATKQSCSISIRELYKYSHRLEASAHTHRNDDHYADEYLYCFYVALNANICHEDRRTMDKRKSRYVCNNAEDNYGIFKFVSQDYQNRLNVTKSSHTANVPASKFKECMPLIHGRNNITVKNFRTLLKIENSVAQLTHYIDTQFQFYRECCDLLQSSQEDRFMENQYLIMKLNEAEKYLSSSEYEIRQQLQCTLNDIKSKAALCLPLIQNFKCSKCSIAMTCPEQVSSCLHAFCTDCKQSIYAQDINICPVCQQPLDDTKDRDTDAIKKFRGFYHASKGSDPSSDDIRISVMLKYKQWTRKSLGRLISNNKNDQQHRKTNEAQSTKFIQTATQGTRINMNYPLLRTSIMYL